MAEDSKIRVVEEVIGALKLYSDGSIVRTEHPDLNIPPSQHPSEDDDDGVASKDIVLDHRHGLWVRLFLPPPQRTNTHLPVIIYFHGGGFCFFSPDFVDFHRFCLKSSAAAGAIIVSVNYRLAPEHRLPVAYNDSAAAIEWLRSQSIKKKGGETVEPWLNSHADFSNVYLMGDSAGGNIVHHLIMRTVREDWKPLQIRGALLLQPYFGGEEYTESELKCPEKAFLNMKGSDTFWRLALPIGANKDHPFSNPFCPQSPTLSRADFPPLMVAVGGKDCLRDRCLEYCDALKKCGKTVDVIVFDEEEHGFYALEVGGESSKRLRQCVASFVSSHSLALRSL